MEWAVLVSFSTVIGMLVLALAQPTTAPCREAALDQSSNAAAAEPPDYRLAA